MTADNTEIRVEQVLPWVTLAVRQQVLRPHQTLAQLRLPGDDDPLTGCFAAYAGDDVVATATVRVHDAPWGPPGWRLRGMATLLHSDASSQPADSWPAHG